MQLLHSFLKKSLEEYNRGINMNENKIKFTVGQTIKNYRKVFGLTQMQLGEIIGINQRQIALIETGKSFPMLSTMTKLAEVFNCSVSDFFESVEANNKETLQVQIQGIINHCDIEELKQIYKILKTIKISA